MSKCTFNKSADGDLVYLFMFDGELNYGIPTEDTGNATTDDGQEYATVKLGDTEYGYGSTNDDATEGFLVVTDAPGYPDDILVYFVGESEKAAAILQ